MRRGPYRWLVLPFPFLAILSAAPSGCLGSFIVDDLGYATGEDVRVDSGAMARRDSTLDIGKDASVLQAGDEAVIEELGTFRGTSFSWDVNVAAGSSVLIQAQDSTGAIAVSKPLDVQAGTTGCALTSASSAPSLTTTTTTSSTTASSTLTTTSSSWSTTTTSSTTTSSSPVSSSSFETSGTTSFATVVATTDGYAVSISSSSIASASSTNPSSSQSTAAASTLGSTSESNSHTALILGGGKGHGRRKRTKRAASLTQRGICARNTTSRLRSPKTRV
uniref:Uncharacterized protein n=1 Tax=Mycena chlorophos TaxID=658473 RepID=A0ABQ0L8T9_MYCCL|nr:predicted protein [Mycena chlorophos]